jgi:glycogen synthase
MYARVASTDTPPGTAAPGRALLSTVQIGLAWFPDGIGGGCGRYFSTLIDYLKARQVLVHGIAAGRVPAAGVQPDGIRIICAHDAPLIERVSAARREVRRALTNDNVDLVASHFALYTSACLDLIRSVPLVVHFHGPWAAESAIEGASRIAASTKFFVEKLVYSRAERVIALSRAFGDILHRSYRVPQEKIRIVPGGVDIERFNVKCSRSSARMHLGLPLDRPIVVVVRRLVKRMGLYNLIASFANLKECEDPLLVIVGSGNLSDVLKQQVNALGLDDSVLFAGRVPDELLSLYYRAADFSVVPSIALEGFGLIVAESLACGTPALVTPVGGLPEVVSPLSERLVLEGNNSAAITDGLRAALSGRLQLPSADQCARYAHERFSWAVIAQRVKGIYEEVL